MFKRLMDALERALASATPPPELGEMASRMREAVIEQKAAVGALRAALVKSEEELAFHQRELATAERRRTLAEGIQDAETVNVAGQYAARMGERVAVLERKVAAQREELALAERELTEMTAQLAEAAKRRGVEASERGAAGAWDALGEAGMDRPGTDVGGEALRSQLERAGHEAAADAKLEELKRRMGR